VFKGLTKSFNMYWTSCINRGGQERANHAAVAIGHRIYSFGGFCTDNMPKYMDVCCFDTISLKWFMANYRITNQSPRSCFGHSVVAYKDRIYLWGGESFFRSCNTLYCFEYGTLSWSIPETSGEGPKITDGHSACVIGDYMYIFGGYEEDTFGFSDKVFRINLITFNWETVLTHGLPPSKRDFHTASVIGNFMYIFGGRSARDSGEDYYLNDIMCLDTDSMVWSTPFCSGRLPNGRRSHSAVVYKGEIYIIGGFDGVTLRHLNDVFKYNPVNSEWIELKVNGEPPCPRKRHCAVLVKDSIYLYGGSSPAQSIVIARDEGSLDMQEHSDLYVLEFFPTLKRLSILNIVDNRIDADDLPIALKEEIEWLKSQSRPAFGRRNYSAFSPTP
ncbi:kelch domain-containing protein 3, partial [Nephila pilipes]